MSSLSRVLLLAVALACVASCGPPERQDWPNTYTGDGEDFFALDDDFLPLCDESWTDVDGTHVTNALDHRAEATALAQSGDEGAFPVGTIIQLFPEEAMVKRGAGFSPDTFDWEFLKLDVASGRTVITERGTTAIANPGGSCISCHAVAEDFDLVCFTNDTCAPLPFFIDTEVDVQRDDARCAGR